MDILFLTTPPQHASANPRVELNPKRLKQWIEALPTINVAETVKQLQAAIEPFNALQLNDVDRFKLLEIFHPFFDETLYTYDDIRLNMLPISPEEREVFAYDIMWLYLALAGGYKIIVKNGFDAGHSPARDMTLKSAVFRAMELIIHALLYAYHAHKIIPPLSYLELSQLYLFAESHKVLDTPIKNIRGYSSTPTINKLYKQFMLFSIADPSQLNPVELYENYMLIERFAGNCRLDQNCTNDQSRPGFTIDLIEDSPPQYHKEISTTQTTPGMRYFNIEPAIEALQSEYGADINFNDSLIMEQEKRLTQTLANLLSNTLYRKEPRRNVNRKIKLTRGLDNVIYLLQHKTNLADIINIEEHSGIEVHDVSDNQLEDILIPCNILNESNSGRLLVGYSAEAETGFENGDIVALAEVINDTAHPVIITGIIRWQKEESTSEAQLGIEILPGEPTPVECNLSKLEQSCTGLYFPALEALQHDERLLLHKKDHQPDETLSLINGVGNKHIQPGPTIIESEHFIQFSFDTD